MSKIDTGDHVRHRPTNDELLVAGVKGSLLMWCGWPFGYCNVDDCDLIQKASKQDRLDLLNRLANMGGNDARKTFAIEKLREESTPWVDRIDGPMRHSGPPFTA